MPGTPAGPPPGPRGGDVIQLRKKQHSFTLHTSAALPAADEPESADPALDLAVTVEGMFLARGQTLTDDATARAYGVALEAVELMVEGAFRQGAFDSEAHQLLAGMLQGMRSTPELL